MLAKESKAPPRSSSHKRFGADGFPSCCCDGANSQDRGRLRPADVSVCDAAPLALSFPDGFPDGLFPDGGDGGDDSTVSVTAEVVAVFCSVDEAGDVAGFCLATEDGIGDFPRALGSFAEVTLGVEALADIFFFFTTSKRRGFLLVSPRQNSWCKLMERSKEI